MGNSVSKSASAEHEALHSKSDKGQMSLTLPKRMTASRSRRNVALRAAVRFTSSPNVYADDSYQQPSQSLQSLPSLYSLELGRGINRTRFSPTSGKLESYEEVFEKFEDSTNREGFSKSDRNCLNLKDVSPSEWKNVIAKLPRVRHLSLSTVWHVSHKGISYEKEPLPIADTLNVGNKLSSLRSLALNEISCPLDFDNLFTFRNHMNRLAELELSNLSIFFSDIDSLAGFTLTLNAHAQSMNAFKLFIRSCKFDVKETGIDASCLMLMALTSRNRMKDITDSVSQLRSSSSDCDENSLDQLTMDFRSGTLLSLLIDHRSFAASCEQATTLFKEWNFRSIPKTSNFEEWEIKCPKSDCLNCSSLLTLLSVAAHQDNFMDSVECQMEASKIDFGFTVFFPEHFSYLFNSMQVSFPDKKFKINALASGLHFKDDSAIEDHVELSLTYITTLQSMGITFSLSKLNLNVDNSGWAFTKIRLTRDPISVKFSNGVEIFWPRNSTKQTRIVSIEVHQIPDDIIEQVCLANKQSLPKVSPIVYIDQKFDLPFEQAVSVEMPYCTNDPKSQLTETNFTFTNQIFSKHGNDKFWKAVPKDAVIFNSNKFVYKSKKFSPVFNISSNGEFGLSPDDFIQPYLASCVFVTVCSSDTYAMNFDCKKFTDEETREEFKVSPFSKIRKVDRMKRGDCIYGAIGGNLRIDERYGYDLEEDKRLLFYYPDPEHMSNPQEYRILHFNEKLDPEGTVTYYLSTDSRESERKLFHLRVKLLTESINGQRTLSDPSLDGDTVTDILEVCGVHWPDLLRKLNVRNAIIADLEDHNLSDVLLEIRGKLNPHQRKCLLLALFSSTGKSATDIDAILGQFTVGSSGEDEDEVFRNVALEWLRTSPRRFRNVQNLTSCFKSSGLTWLVPSVEAITPGARHRVLHEVFRKFDAHSDKAEFIEEIAKFLIKQDDASCKNMAFELLLNAHRK